MAARDRWLAAALSVAAHLSILLALLWGWKEAPRSIERAPVTVTLVDDRTPAAAPAPAPSPAPARPSSAKPPPSRQVPSPLPAPASVAARATDEAPSAGASPKLGDAGLSDAALAGAARVGGGSPTGACDMARRLQTALRRDPLVQAAVAGRGAGKAILVWNGDWVQSDGEDGKGLAAVREAIMWEIAFAPPACRSEPVRGLVLFSLRDAPGSQARLAVGSDQWRWSDLLTPRRAY